MRLADTKPEVLNKFGGKDATKPFRKTHNERILKQEGYRNICLGTLGEEGGATEKQSIFRTLFGKKSASPRDAKIPVLKDEKLVKAGQEAEV
jgi:hypothetical protein